jgi:hypothetical protein
MMAEAAPAPAPEVEPEADDLRATLEAAFEEHEAESVSTPLDSDPVPTPSSEEIVAQDAPATSENDHLEGDFPTERLSTAPAGWKPAAREGWEALPEHVRQEVHRREQDIATGLQESADARKLEGRFNELINPYRPLLQAEGVTDPLKLVEGTLGMINGMRNGSPQQKARFLAEMVSQYDVDLKVLDETLTAQIQGQAPADDPVARLVDERMAPVNALLETLQSRLDASGQQRQEKAAAEVDTFASTAEFLSDVRLDMADLLDMAASRGRTLSIQDAYDIACRAHPEVSKVIAEREQRTQANAQASHLAAKAELAGTPVRPNGAAPAAPVTDGSLRADIIAAFEAQDG